MLFEYLKKLFLSPSELVDYQTRIVGVIDDIDDKGKLVALLKQIYQEMSPYDYESISIMLNLGVLKKIFGRNTICSSANPKSGARR